MKRFTNILIQSTASAAQVINIFTPVLSDKNKIYATGILSIAQGVTAIIAHNSNPDGTPASVGYVKGK